MRAGIEPHPATLRTVFKDKLNASVLQRHLYTEQHACGDPHKVACAFKALDSRDAHLRCESEVCLAYIQQCAGRPDLRRLNEMAAHVSSFPWTKYTVCDTFLITNGDLGFTMSQSPTQLLTVCRTYQDLRASLLRNYPELDDDTLADTLEGITELPELLSALIRSILEDRTLVAGLTQRLTDMRARHERLSTRIEKKRALALACMRDASITALTQPDYSAFVRKVGPRLEIVAEAQIPSQFWKPQAPTLDRAGLLSALKGGEAIPGAALLTTELQLSVRKR